jgi:hypothetical protein
VSPPNPLSLVPGHAPELSGNAAFVTAFFTGARGELQHDISLSYLAQDEAGLSGCAQQLERQDQRL